MLCRMNLHGRDPFEPGRRVTVVGIADRHYRAPAEDAWTPYHAGLLLAVQTLAA